VCGVCSNKIGLLVGIESKYLSRTRPTLYDETTKGLFHIFCGRDIKPPKSIMPHTVHFPDAVIFPVKNLEHALKKQGIGPGKALQIIICQRLTAKSPCFADSDILRASQHEDCLVEARRIWMPQCGP
jgi:hypothetical protein